MLCLLRIPLTRVAVSAQIEKDGHVAVDNVLAKLYADGHIYQFKVPEPFGSVVSPLFAERAAAAQAAAAASATILSQ